MPTMLDPNEIRLSVLRGQKLDNCQVFRGSASGGGRFALKYALFYIISYTVLFSATSTWMQYFHLAPGLNVEPLIIDMVIFLLMGIVVFCIASSTAKNSAIVLFPDGWIAFNDIQYNLPKMQKFISYASLTDIQLSYNFFVGPYLVLRYHEGKARKWSPSNYLARSTRMMILQSILVDYVMYKRSFKECL